MKRTLFINVALFQVWLLGVLLALPCMAELPQGAGPIDLKGEVIDWVWRAEMAYSQEGDSTQTYQRKLPDHYLIVLKVANGNGDYLKRISSLVRLIDVQHPVMQRKLANDEVLLILSSGRIKEMDINRTFEIVGYELVHSLGWTRATCQRYTIDGKSGTMAGHLFDENAIRTQKPK